jgi:peptidyl-prolyl cis-trans isomerase SurA
LRFLKGIPVVLLVLLATAPLAAQRLDGIVAVVNDEPVLESDVEEQLVNFIQQSKVRPDSALIDTLRHQILEQLIDNKLVVTEAQRQGITVSDAEINKQLDAAIAQKKEELGGEQAYQDQLIKENLTESKLREKYRTEIQHQMIGRRLLDKLFPQRSVPQAEAEAFFKAHPEKFPKVPAQVRVAVVQIPPTPDSVADAKGRAAALAARKRILAGEKFAKVAAELSDDPSSARSGGDLGFFAQGTMEQAIDDAAFHLKLGQVSEPVRTPYGWHLVEPIERDTVKTVAGRDSLAKDGKPLLEAHARHILIKVPLGDADIDRAKKLAERVRGEALKGTDFGVLARRYSKYQGPHDENGDLGFISVEQLQSGIRDGLDSLEIGQVSEVLTNQLGFNIFKVIDRKASRPYTLDEIKEELPQAVGDIQSREKYDAWVKGLRAKAQIEYR